MLTDRLHLFCPINIPHAWWGVFAALCVCVVEGLRGRVCVPSYVCIAESGHPRRETCGVCVVCEWFVCVCASVWESAACPASRGSAAKTIICDRSARVDSLPRDSLTLSDDQNRKKLIGRRVKVSE